MKKKKKNKTLCFYWSRSVAFYKKSLEQTLPEIAKLYSESHDLYVNGDFDGYNEMRSKAFELDNKWFKEFCRHTDHVKHLSMKAEKTHRTRPQKRHEAIWLNMALATQFRYYEIAYRAHLLNCNPDTSSEDIA